MPDLADLERRVQILEIRLAAIDPMPDAEGWITNAHPDDAATLAEFSLERFHFLRRGFSLLRFVRTATVFGLLHLKLPSVDHLRNLGSERSS